MLEFVQNIGIMNMLVIVFIFAIFLVLTKKIIKTIINMVWISVVSVIFPFILKFLGFPVLLNLETILFFLILGLGLYFIYILGRVIYIILGFVEKSAGIMTYPFRDKNKELEKKVGKIIYEKEKKGKKGKKEEE
jgi:hypothetical protein